MCGIVGILAYHDSAPPVEREELLRVRDHMFRRGPDGEGLWLSDSRQIGFGHRRLAIIDLSPGGAQPMHSADGRYVITFNGEIYNYRELRAELEARGFAFRSQSDTEVLLHLYADRGPKMLDALRGMFAFGLWDNLERTLFMARDAFGIKPLYYADDGKSIRFASQVKALLAGGRIDTTPEPAGHTGFYLWGSVPEPYTLYRGIRALPAGHYAFADAHGLRKSVAWCSVPDVLADAARNPARSDRPSAIAALAAMTRTSVSAHTVADVPVGIFLSAGLDSAIVASAAIFKAPQSFTLTLGFEEYAGTADDEVPLAEQMARLVEAWHNTLMVSRKDFEAERESLMAAMDQPSIDGVNTWFVARAAAHMELKVALSGLGGDELFASYPSFRQVPKLVRYCAPFAKFPGIGRGLRTLAAPLLSQFTSPKYAGLLEYGTSRGGAYLLRRCLFAPWELDRILEPELAWQGIVELQCMAQLNAAANMPSDRLAVSAMEMNWYMRNQLLRDADWAGMAQSLEIRVPFVDIQLLREAAPLLAAHPDITKAEVAAAVNPRLPTAVLDRPKTGFSVPVREWLLPDSGKVRERGLRGWAKFIHRSSFTSPTPPGASRADNRHATSSGPSLPECGLTDVPGGRNKTRVLVTTIGPSSGGVNTMTEFVVQTLVGRGVEPVIAHYEPYSISPQLSVPSFKLFRNKVRNDVRTTHGNLETHAIGAWLPELEFTNYYATRLWRTVMDSCSAFVAVSGNVLASTPYQQTGRPFVAWVATDWEGDRKDRVKHFSGPRRLLDRMVNRPVIKRLERRLLGAGTILPLSRYTATMLSNVAGQPTGDEILSIPIDSEFFLPAPDRMIPRRIGFTGRIDDPRKNIGLLLDAMAILLRKGADVTAVLVGGSPTADMQRRTEELGLTGRVHFVSMLPPAQLLAQLQTMDVFVLPSHQEGLCIAALEAMSCGLPVVSTRCGGPEEFVIPGETGILVDFDADEMALAILKVLDDRSLRRQLSTGARALIEARYNRARAESVFWNAFEATFPKLELEKR